MDRDGVAKIAEAAWRDVLDVDEVSPEDEFFALGGHSLMAVELAERLERELGITFPLDALFTDGRFSAVVSACLQEVVADRSNGGTAGGT